MTSVDEAASKNLQERLENSNQNWRLMSRGPFNVQPPWYLDILARVLRITSGDEIVYLTSGVKFSSNSSDVAILALTSKAVIHVVFEGRNGSRDKVTSSIFLRSRISEVELVRLNRWGNPTEPDLINWEVAFVRDDGERYVLPMAIDDTTPSTEVAELFPSLLEDMERGV